MDKKLVVMLLLFFLAFGLFASVLIFNKPLTQLARAKEELVPSAEKSKILAYPLYSISANGNSESSVSVFINSLTEKPLSGKLVTLTSTLGKVSPQSATTDNNGKAVFQVSSDAPGVAELEATVENIKLQQKVSVKFE